LGSLDPLEVTDDLLAFLAQSKKFCAHFHLSLQSMCDKTLHSMNRNYSVKQVFELVDKINSEFELPFIGSDIIVGFAGETDEDFEATRANLEKLALSQIHVFPYSVREGTLGATLQDQVPDKVKQERAKIIRLISSEKHAQFLAQNQGKSHEILIEKSGKKGITRNYITINIDGTPNTLLTTAL
jgi:threonylcarbamoyladenosine tRNA methylthiotransferase MtaB